MAPAPVFPACFDEKQLADEGFPSRVAQGFLDTATELDAAVASRCPRKPATQLIDDGHALKSFYIHAKSCDWGPMAGFVCQLPPLNKKGPDNMGFNLDEHVKSIAKFRRLVDEPAAKHPDKNREAAAAAEGLAEWPFVPISISRKALDRLFADGHLVDDYTGGDTTGSRIPDTSEICGVSWNESKNVLVEFVARRSTRNAGEWWALYHRQIWVKDQAGTFDPYLAVVPGRAEPGLTQPDTERLKPLTNMTELTQDVINRLDDYRTLWVKANSANCRPSSLPSGSAYPILGAQNPYPPYAAGDPRNAVAGDYDLFAVWPRTLESRWEETVRRSESKSQDTVQADTVVPALFRAVPRRHFTVELANAPGIHLEVIPGFEEIESYEDPVKGNINDAVELTVGILNSRITHLYDRRRKAPNAAFHSDEGGRPGVNEIDYPVAVFLPATLREKPGKGAVILRNHKDFLTLLEQLNGRCYLPLNFGWMIHLLADIADEGQLEAARAKAECDAETQKKVDAYIAKRKEAQQAMTPDELGDLRRRAAALLTGRSNALDAEPTKTAFLNAIRTFLDVACLQLDEKAKVAAMVTRILHGTDGS